MPLEVIYSLASALLGTLLGVYLAPRVQYPFQKKLLLQQHDFQRQQAEEDARQRQQIAETIATTLTKLQQVVGSLSLNIARQDSLDRPDM